MDTFRKQRVVSALLLVAATCSSLLVAATPATAQSPVAGIYACVAETNQFMRQNRKSARVFADVSGSDEKTDRWQEFRNEDEMEKVATGDNLYTIAFVWTKTGKLIGTSFTFTSPSGDWAHFVTYYFRDDGSLAKIGAQLNTFNGDLSVFRQLYFNIRQLYFNNRGVLLKNTRRYVDLKTKKAKKPGGEFFDHAVPVYRNVQALPFHTLL